MPQPLRERLLRVVLVLVGVISLLGLYPLFWLWPAGWRWHPYHPAYEHMIAAVYAMLGIFLLRATGRPAQNRSLILFAGWSFLAHGGVMAVDAARTVGERGHFVGDIPALIVAGVLLLVLSPPSERSRAT
jgi:hypothetical protein